MSLRLKLKRRRKETIDSGPDEDQATSKTVEGGTTHVQTPKVVVPAPDDSGRGKSDTAPKERAVPVVLGSVRPEKVHETVPLADGGFKRRRVGSASWQYYCKHGRQRST